MRPLFRSLIIPVALAAAAHAAPQTFDFKDPKGVNNVVFKLDAPLEAITGSASGISGTITFDPEAPAATRGRLVVTTTTLHVPNPMMKEHLHGEQWMSAARHPEIVFEASELANVKKEGDSTTADASGTLTIKGVAKKVAIPVKFTYLKDKLGQRIPGKNGDLLVVRSNFSIQRSEFGINPGAPQDKVADTIELTLSIAGAAAR